METRLNYAAVGLFVIVLGAGAVIAGTWLLFGDVQKTYRTYHVYMTESVSGLVDDAAVRYRGVEVGRVADIGLENDNPERVKLTLSIEQSAPIKSGTRAVLKSQGLTGLYFVELTGGTKEQPRLTEVSEREPPVIPAEPSLFVRLDDAVSNLLEHLNGIAGDLSLVLNEENAQRVSATLDNLAKVTGTLAEQRQVVADGVGDLRAAARDLRRLSDALAGRGGAIERTLENVAEASGDLAAGAESVPKLLEHAGDIAERLDSAGEQLNALLRESRAGVASLSQNAAGDLSALLSDARAAMRAVEQLARRLERHPESLVHGPRARQPGPGERGSR